MGWIVLLIIVLLVGVVVIPVAVFLYMITPSKTLSRFWGGFYSIDLDKITLQSADNVRMLSNEQIDGYEARLD